VTVPSRLPQGDRVAVAYDGSLQAARTIQAFQNTGLDEGRKIDVLSIAPTHLEAARHADRAAEFLRLHDLDAESHPIASTASPAKVLLEQVRELDAALLVMGAYGQPTWREFFFGSVTRTMLKHSPIPLFLYH
jgi:nucleotide-binding universal stress UspA family protein